MCWVIWSAGPNFRKRVSIVYRTKYGSSMLRIPTKLGTTAVANYKIVLLSYKGCSYYRKETLGMAERRCVNAGFSGESCFDLSIN